MSGRELRLPAIEVEQAPGVQLYSFAVDGKLLPKFTTVSRIGRSETSGGIEGYQRPEVGAHIGEIRAYLESERPMLPNALVVAFDSRVRFEADETTGAQDFARSGVLVVPIETGCPVQDMPGWIVDGQQRAAAIREAELSAFPVFVTAFITDSVERQRSQFILVNSTKPLPKGLIHELLPETGGHLPSALQRKRFPAMLSERLNHDADSPLKGRIRTPTNSSGLIKDNSVLRMIESSLSDGALFRFRDPMTGEGDEQSMLQLLKNFWAAVGDVFEEAWNLPPRRSRLVHGVGIVSLGFVMDAIADRVGTGGLPSVEVFAADLRELSPVCCWTRGVWEFGPDQGRKWNELQNTSRDIYLLANFLLSEYRARVWARREATA